MNSKVDRMLPDTRWPLAAVVLSGPLAECGRIVSGAVKIIGVRDILNRRSVQLACLVMMMGLFVIGCSVSLKDRESSVLWPTANEIVEPKASPSSSRLLSNYDISSERGSFSEGPGLPIPVQYLSPVSSIELISVLEQVGLWGGSLNAEVPPVLIDAFPEDLDSLDVEAKKMVFFHSLLPVVMVALEEIRLERATVQSVIQKIACEPAEIFFSEQDTSWQGDLSLTEIIQVRALTRKYRNVNAAKLLKRIDVLPVSLVLAQGAIESSWGTSRFASLGNNLFGMWTWGEKGIVPMAREDGKKHKIAVYNSILDSVRAYILTINRLPAYKHLRDLRVETSDPILLSQGLLNYSERREEYVNDLQKIISHNRLDDLDKHILATL